MQVQQQRGMRRGASGMYSVIVVFFFLYSPLMFFSLLFFSDRPLTTKGGADTQSEAGRDRTNAGQDKGAAEWEEEVEGRAGGLRRRVGRGGWVEEGNGGELEHKQCNRSLKQC